MSCLNYMYFQFFSQVRGCVHDYPLGEGGGAVSGHKTSFAANITTGYRQFTLLSRCQLRQMDKKV